MNRALMMSYETMGASSYMTVTFPPEVEVVNYQLEMALSNEIKNFLALSRQMLDGETVIYYNITSRISLKQVLEKRKLNRKELIRLIEGAILAVRDAAAYRLPSSGLVMEPEYIYVNPASCAPAFMFLPLEEPAGLGIKELISELVLHDKIELSGDNFVQVILMELNRQPFSLEQLEKSLKLYNKTEPGGQELDQRPVIRQPERPAPPFLEREPARAQPVEFRTGQSVMEEKRKAPDLPKQRGAENDKKAGKQKATRKNNKEGSRESGNEGFNRDKAKKKFLLPQLLLMVALAAGVSFGIFTNESGGIALKNILAFVILAALAEWILYREIYINGRFSEQAEGEKASNGKTAVSGKKTGLPKPTPRKNFSRQGSLHSEPRRPRSPYSESLHSEPSYSESLHSEPSHSESLHSEPSRPEFPRSEFPSPISSWPAPQPAMDPVDGRQSTPYSGYGGGEDTDLGGETEFWSEGAGNSTTAYLEYFENGRLSRITMGSQDGIVVGRLKQQVDFEVKSPRVGKVHARFYCQDGQCYVVDINSKNGTYINGSGSRIESNVPYPLRDKDRITLADSEFTIRCSES